MIITGIVRIRNADAAGREQPEKHGSLAVGKRGDWSPSGGENGADVVQRRQILNWRQGSV